jgi:beta-aspartyl-peptidase (threonine type)
MKKSKLFILISITILIFYGCQSGQDKQVTKTTSKDPIYALVLHGGAGYIKNLPPDVEKKYREKLNEALEAGYLVLKNGGTATEAVQKTINIMEDSPIFNAGKGCVLNSLGKPEMDASIMNGATLNAGAVAGVSHIKNPINAAILVKDSSRHVLLSGKGAEMFWQSKGLPLTDESYFIIPKRLEQLKKIQEQEKSKEVAFLPDEFNGIKKYGTVGCVALDQNGSIAAGTSTGGLMNKQFGRIGDSPIIGAGTYAENETCGISCTGTGEYFIRTVAAHSVSDLMKYQNLDLLSAQKQVINKIASLGGDGGMIGLDKQGHIAWYFNTEGMFRAYKKSDGSKAIEMYQ